MEVRGAFSLEQDGINFILSYTAIPEHGTVVLLVISVTLLLIVIRRRRVTA